MNEALKLAQQAAEKDCIPVGAIVVYNNAIISQSHNTNEPSEHAELIALKKAYTHLGHKIRTCELYVTLEPCAMCCGAIAHYKISKVYFGAYDTKGGAVENGPKVFQYTCHKPEIYGGFQEKESALILKDFFKTKREKITLPEFNTWKSLLCLSYIFFVCLLYKSFYIFPRCRTIMQ